VSETFDRWMPFYINDFFGSYTVSCMSERAQLLYLRALCAQWQHGELPAELPKLRMILGRGVEGFDELWQEVAPCFDLIDGKLQNGRCAEEREKAMAKSRQSAKAARAKHRQCGRSADALRTHSERSADALPIQNSTEQYRTVREEPPLPPTGDAPADESKPSKRRKAETWQAVLEQPEFATLKADPAFALAWQDWVKHCRTAGSKAKEPQGIRAAKIFREAMREGSARYARAIEQAIIHNWQGIWVRDDVRPSQQAAAQPRNASQRNLDILQSSFEKLGIIGTQERLL